MVVGYANCGIRVQRGGDIVQMNIGRRHSDRVYSGQVISKHSTRIFEGPVMINFIDQQLRQDSMIIDT